MYNKSKKTTTHTPKNSPRTGLVAKSEYVQERPQSHTADQPTAP